MNIKPGISVLMCIYKEPEAWLIESFDSVLNQTFTDLEFIIVNDNPDSETNKKILEKYSSLDSRVRVVNNEQNSGPAVSANAGIKIAQGKYLARLDADDVAFPTRLALQYDFLEKKSDYIACGATGSKVLEANKTDKILYKPATAEEVRAYLFISCPIIHSTLMLRRINDAFLIYDTHFRYSLDFDYCSSLVNHGKICNFQSPLIYYRISSIQITSKNLVRQNQYANEIRNKNSKSYLLENYNIDLSSYESPQKAVKTLISLIQKNPADKLNLSAILYSTIFYSDLEFYSKVKYILKSQFIVKLKKKYRLKLLFSIFKKFNEQVLS